MERQAAAVRRRCRVGHQVQRRESQWRVERDVARAKGSASTRRSTSSRSGITAAKTPRRGTIRKTARSRSPARSSTRSCRGRLAVPPPRPRRSCRPSGKTTKRSRGRRCSPRSASGSRTSATTRQALGAEASHLPKFTEFEKPWIGSNQPLRTDCELVLNGVPFVDVEIDT